MTNSYDLSGRVITQTDSLSQVTTIDWSGAPTKTLVTYPATSFDPNWHPVEEDTYDGDGRITQHLAKPTANASENVTTTYSYDASSNLASTTDARGNTTNFCYDVDYAGTTISGSHGNLTRRIEPPPSEGANRPVTLYQYDTKNNLVQQIPPLGVSSGTTVTCSTSLSVNTLYATDFTYDTATKTKLESSAVYSADPDTGAVVTATTKYQYDDSFNKGMVTQVIAPRGNTGGTPDLRYAITNTYYASGTVAAGLLMSTTDPYTNTTSYEYDAAGRRTKMVDPNGNAPGASQGDHSWEYTYDAGDRLLASKAPTPTVGLESPVTQYRYDQVGNRTVITDANGQVTKYAYDERDSLLRVLESPSAWSNPDVLPSDVITTEYEYDGGGNLTQVTRAKSSADERAVKYTYDGLNRLRQEIQYPDWPTTTLALTTTYSYDANSNRTVITDAMGYTTTYSYDPLNRLISTTYTGTPPSVSYSYDANGRRLAMADGAGTTSYSYDELGRLLTVTVPGPKATAYRYDLDGNRTKLIYPDSTAVTYTFDYAGRLASLADWASRVITYTYDRASRLTGAQLPNQTQTSYEFDNANRLAAITNTASVSTTGVLTSPSHTYASAGIYSVTLTAGGADGTSTITRTQYITAFESGDNFLNGSATMQRQPWQGAPDASWQTTLTVRLLPPGSSTPSYTKTVSSDDLGHFTIAQFVTGTYSITVKGSHTVGNIRTNVDLEGSNELSFCTLLEGDVNDNNAINIADFSLMSGAYGSMPGDPNWDARADLNQDGVVNDIDGGMLEANFGKSGYQNCTGGQAPEAAAPVLQPGAAAHLALSPGAIAAAPGELVSLTIALDTGDQPVGVVAAHLDFDPSLLQVVDAYGDSAAAIEPKRSPMEWVLQNKVDNDAGRISFAVATLASNASGRFAVGTIRLRVIGQRDSGPATISFVFDDGRNRATAVNYRGERLTGDAQGAVIDIGGGLRSETGSRTSARPPSLILGASAGPGSPESWATKAGFVAQTRAGHAPFTATFSDTTSGSVTWRLWSFGDGAIAATPYANFRYVLDGAGNRVALDQVVPEAAGPAPATGTPEMWAWGSNYEGQVGDGTTTDRPDPTRVVTPTDVLMVDGGWYHSLAVDANGTAWAWGSDDFGQLGNGAGGGDSRWPVQVSISPGLTIQAVAGGYVHSLGLRADGRVLSWGSNSYGQLGDNTATNRSTPVDVLHETGSTVLTGTTAIDTGGTHSIALKSDGTLRAWGRGTLGQLGNGGTADHHVPITVTGPVTPFVAIAAGGEHNLAIDNDGHLWAWGSNESGQLGVESTGVTCGSTPCSKEPILVPGLANVVAVGVGTSHNLAVKSDGSVWAWGTNGYGQLGDGTTTGHFTPTQVSALGAVSVTAVAAGDGHSLARDSAGGVWAWGNNSAGQLGDGTTITRTTPVLVDYPTGVWVIGAGWYHSLAVAPRHDVTAYQYDRRYQLTGAVAPSDSTTYQYDRAGNRAVMTRTASTTYSYDRADRITNAGATGYTVNDAGNLVARGSDGFGYDHANRLITATVGGITSTYTYDGDGKRITRTVGLSATAYVYDVNRSLPVVLDDGSRKYVWGLGLAYAVDSSGQAYVYYGNGLGSIRAVGDITGTIVQTYRTDEFGVPILTQGVLDQPFEYTGEQRDSETGLVYLRARMYEPGTGRFASRDIWAGDSDIPLTLDRFLYGLGNPVSRADPSGRKSLALGVGACIPCRLVDLLRAAGQSLPRMGAWISQILGRNPAATQAAGRLTVGAGTFSQSEMRVAQELARRGLDVVLKTPVGQRSAAGGTADLLIGGRPYDVYTPITSRIDNIVSSVASKGDQAYGVVVDLSNTTVKAAELGSILQRVQRAGSHLQDVILLFGE